MKTEYQNVPVDTIISWFKDGLIEIPTWQRESAWDPKRRRFFIDSVIKKLPFGQIVLHVSGDKRYLVDGQQRVVSLFSYVWPDEPMLKRIPHPSDHFGNWAKIPVKDYGTWKFLSWERLPQDLKIEFRSASCSIALVDGTANDVGRIFRRLQNGLPLKTGDILHASTASTWYSTITNIAEHPVMQSVIAVGKRRAGGWMLSGYLLAVYLSNDVCLVNTLENVERVLDKRGIDTKELTEAGDDVRRLLDIIEKVDGKTYVDNGSFYSRWTKMKRITVLFNLLCRTEVNRSHINDVADVITENLIAPLNDPNNLLFSESRSRVQLQRRLNMESDLYQGMFEPIRLALQKVVPDRDKLRFFTSPQKEEIFQNSDGRCAKCTAPLIRDWEADHIKPWSRGGPTTVDNGQALCLDCHKDKTEKDSLGSKKTVAYA